MTEIPNNNNDMGRPTPQINETQDDHFPMPLTVRSTSNAAPISRNTSTVGKTHAYTRNTNKSSKC